MDAKLSRLNKQFDSLIQGSTRLTKFNYLLFLEAIYSASDLSACIQKLICSKAGISCLKNAMQLDVSSGFMNGHATKLLFRFHRDGLADLGSGLFLLPVLQALVEPPIFWDAFQTDFKNGNLQVLGQQAFGWLLFQLVRLPTHKGGDRYRTAAAPMHKLLCDSPYPDVRSFGYKIQNVLATYDTEYNRDLEYGPGGRHDNDFLEFRKVAIFPTAAELSCKEPSFLLPASMLDDPETSSKRVALHLDNQFRLLREDMIFEMREELSHLLSADAKPKKKKRALHIKGLSFVDLFIGDPQDPKNRYRGWALNFRCGDSVFPTKDRKKYLEENTYIFKHQSFTCLLVDNEPVAFPSIYRNENLLAQNPPVVTLEFRGEASIKKALKKIYHSSDIKLLQIDTPIFAYEPVLRALQDKDDLPLSDELLHFKECDELPLTSHIISDTFLPTLKGHVESGSDLKSILGTSKSIHLDESQAQSLMSGLTDRVSLIQGPPGTGKSFIGALLSKVIHDRSSETILVVCYTNHALDQFIEDLRQIGIPSQHIIRLGGKANPQTEDLTLRKQPRIHRLGRFDREEVDLYRARASLYAKNLRGVCQEYRLFSPTRHLEKLMEHIEISHPEYFDAFRVPLSEEGVVIVGAKGKAVKPTYLLERWKNNQNLGIFASEVNNKSEEAHSIWKADMKSRQETVSKWVEEMLEEIVDRFHDYAFKYTTSQEQVAKKFTESDVAIIRDKRIIACTTTGAAKFREEITAASPGVLIVEEAGEILESHIITALSSGIKHLILIGDHQQLRPKVNNYLLTVEKGEGYDLNMSLFERLVTQGYPHHTLTQQHRMRPEISSFLRKLTYPDLCDAPSTCGRPSIRGVEKPVVFIDHTHPEDDFDQLPELRDSGAKSSKRNFHEVQMIWKLVRYLGQQGYGTQDIVVLTPYLGQLRELREALKTDADPILNDLDSFDLVRAGLLTESAAKLTRKPIRLATIDNYQGEESDIVLISLTRSNSNHDIGFMSSKQRLTVLLSRARNGMFLIGNAQTFMKSRKGGDAWTTLIDQLKKGEYIYSGLPVFCERHPSRKALLREPEDFDNYCPDGGCTEQCRETLPCGHSCPSRCHQISDHSKMGCNVPIFWDCDAGHPQQRKCREPQKPCLLCEAARTAALKKQKEDFEYRARIAALEEKIIKEREAIKGIQLANERQKALDQKEDDLRQAKSSADYFSQAQKQKPEPTTTEQFPNGAETNNTVKDSRPSPDSAQAQWELQKRQGDQGNQAVDAIMAMTGLETVKKEILAIKNKVDLAMRQGTDLRKERFNIAMLGNPGTGKTTVARHYAKFLTSCAIIPGSGFDEVTGSSLGHEGIPGAKKRLQDLLQQGGGALFIDEAYQLTSGHNSGGAQVLDFLLAEMENKVGTLVFIFAGYDREMEQFWEHNPGLKSRVPYTMRFKDYEDEELLHMLGEMIKRKWQGQMKVEGKDGINGLYGRIVVRRLGSMRGCPGFGNARDLENMLARITQRQASRIRKLRDQGQTPDDFLLTKEDLIGPEPAKVQDQSPAWKELQSMIGLGAIKDAIRNLFTMNQTNYERELLEKKPHQVSLNRVFIGSPGTGKTTVAKFYGQILAELGVLSNGEVLVRNPADFIGNVLGESESKTKGILAASLGKVLVIDEAYMLHGGSGSNNGNQDPYKTAVIDTIVAEVQSVPGEDRCVLLLGYKKQMEAMFQNVNPGLSRRFAMEDAFIFADYNDTELLQALELKLKKGDLSATERAKRVAVDVLAKARNRPNFGNIGEVENLLTKAKLNYQKRQGALSPSMRSPDAPFEPEDFDPEYDRSARASENLVRLFEDVTGGQDIREKLETWQRIAQTCKATGKDARQVIPTSFVFKGPPGTGKTTTARKMGQVYYDMGFLSSAEVVECSASDLVGQYVGHTGPKTRGHFEKARGRVLFIDEAYRLSEGQFAKEAMDEMVALMTDEEFKGRMIVILAGYDREINDLLSKNPGLGSRFPEEIVFKSLTPTECVEVLVRSFKKQGVQVKDLEIPTTSGYQTVAQNFEQLAEFPSWGNARDVLELSKRCIMRALSTVDPGSASGSDTTLDLPCADVIDLQCSMLSKMEGRMTSSFSGLSTAPQQPSLMGPSQISQPPPRLGRKTATKTSTSKAPDPTDPSQEDPMQAAEGADKRDPGVSDAIWNQLQIDKRKNEEEERRTEESINSLRRDIDASNAEEDKAQQKIIALKKAEDQCEEDEERKKLMRQREEERLRMHQARLEQAQKAAALAKVENERREEARVQTRLRQMGVCVAGFRWIKQANGYRCAGGAHYITNAQLGI